MASASPGASTDRVRRDLLDLLEPLVTGAGFDLEDITVSRAGRRSLVRLVVDADGGIDLDAVATVSRIVSEALDTDLDDTSGPLGRTLAGSYVLEVTSPGVDRPLTEPRHWRRAVGRLVNADAHGKKITGRVVGADADGATLDVKGRQQTVAWNDLGSGKVQIEFNRKDEEDQRW